MGIRIRMPTWTIDDRLVIKVRIRRSSRHNKQHKSCQLSQWPNPNTYPNSNPWNIDYFEVQI